MTKSINVFIIMIINMSMINLFINLIPSYYKMLHPLIMGAILMVFNILTSLNLSIYFNNNWMSYISFIIIIGGMMILFLYFISFISNMITSLKLMFFKNMMLKMSMLLIMFMFIIMNINNKTIWYNNYSEIYNLMNIEKKNLLNNQSSIMYMYMYNKNINLMISMLYLLLSLMLIVKMIMINKFTLRKISFYEKI